MRKLLSKAAAFGIIASTSLLSVSYAGVSDMATPSLNSKTNAEIEVTNPTANTVKMNIQIQGGQGGVGTLNWNSYHVGKNANVNYEFTAHNQTALNKVDAAAGMSQIYGSITDSGCYNCGYEGTGKVILLNPNGVLFGSGANINLNSFTVSNMDGTYNTYNRTLSLKKGENQSKTPIKFTDADGVEHEYTGIIVDKDAEIYGDKNVAFAADNIRIYKGSKITTNTKLANTTTTDGVVPVGKVKLITSDGVNFAYQPSGFIDSLSNITASADSMTLHIEGDITSGHIDARNKSTHADSELNTKGANLKAYRAEKGSDGNIWLTSDSRIITEETTIATENVNSSAANRKDGGDVLIYGINKTALNKNNINAVGNVTLRTTGANGKAYVDVKGKKQTNDGAVKVDSSTITSAKNVNINAYKIGSVQNYTTVEGQNVTVKANDRAQIAGNSTVKSTNGNVNLISVNDLAWTNSSKITSSNDINIESTNNAVRLDSTTNNATRDINIKSKNDISSSKLATSTFNAGRDINVNSTSENILLTGTEPFNETRDLNLTAAKDVQIVNDNALTVSDVNITAGNDVLLKSNGKTLTVDGTTKFKNVGGTIYLQGGEDVLTTNKLDINNLKTNIAANRNVNVTLDNAGNRNNGLVALAGNDMTITTDGTLSVSDLRSTKDMTINANKVIAGLPYTNEEKLPVDTTTPRSYIEVGGTFTSNVTQDDFENAQNKPTIQSGDLTSDGKFNKRHHIQYGPDEKILLVNKRPVENNVTKPDIDGTDDGTETDILNPGDDIPSTPPVIPTIPDIPTQPDQPDQPNPPVQPDDPSCIGDPAANDVLNQEDDPTAGM